MASGLPRVVCPGCGGQVAVTNAARKEGEFVPIIQAHNPLPGNSMNVSPYEPCPASETPIEVTQAA